MINLGITGATGKMGREIISLSKQDSFIQSITGYANTSCSIDGIDVFDDIEKLSTSHIIIDFSTHSMIDLVLNLAVKNKIPLVIGTTGFTSSELSSIAQASQEIPILLSPNMSVGVNIFALILEYASKYLDSRDASILDIHHKAKLDSPSGTAKMLANVANIPFEKISSMRVGDVIGEHSVVFALERELITLSHSAIDRSIFARGSLTAMHWLLGKSPSLYTMRDILL